MNLTLSIPTLWLQELHPMFDGLKGTEASQRRMLVELLSAAAAHNDGRKLAASPDTSKQVQTRIPAYLPNDLAHQIKTLAKLSDMLVGGVAKALLFRLWTDRPTAIRLPETTLEKSPLAEALVQIGNMEVRPEQIAVHGHIEDALRTGRIGMVEASTGVGKTMATMFAATRWVQASAATCCIAAPTIQILRQFIAEYRRLSEVVTCPPLQITFGRREFVSTNALQEILRDQPDLAAPQVMDWISKGGVPRLDDGVESAWLAEELLGCSPSFPIDEVRLTALADPKDSGNLAYRAQFAKGPELDATVIVCTHAMLAQDMRLRLRAAGRDADFVTASEGVFELLSNLKGSDKASRGEMLADLKKTQELQGRILAEEDGIQGLLPRYGSLLVDEAHMLEQNFSSAMSEYLSLKKLVRSLAAFKRHGGKIASATIEQAEMLVGRIGGRTHGVGYTALGGKDMDATRWHLAQLQDLLQPVALVSVRSKSHERNTSQAEIRRGFNLLRLALNGAMSRAYMRMSPQKGYPQLYVGRDNIENILQMLWASVSAGAGISATLYLLRATGPSAAYIGGLLGIPDERRAEYPPIEATWLSTPLSGVYVPELEAAQMLRPPSRQDKLSETEYAQKLSQWLDAVARTLEDIHSAAAGGMLVLNTSYEMIEGLEVRLEKSGIALVIASSESGVARQAANFLELRKAGQKPVWLAVGGAWTGLDVGGHEPWSRMFDGASLPAELDQVLTDLVIPRLPFGTNNSISHLRRCMMKPSVPWDVLDAAFKFRQALGRLVRRQGLPKNRRIWVLDGRMADADAQARLATFWAPLVKLRKEMLKTGGNG